MFYFVFNHIFVIIIVLGTFCASIRYDRETKDGKLISGKQI